MGMVRNCQSEREKSYSTESDVQLVYYLQSFSGIIIKIQ